jgi:hypothetical protein
MAGHDLILKAKESADLTATNHDVRIKAERNMQVVAGSDDGSAGGILLESRSKSAGPWSGEGEAAQSSGIILKAPDSGIFASGSKVRLNAPNRLTLDGFDKEGANKGVLQISTERIMAATTQGITLGCEDTSALLVSRAGTLAVGPYAMLVGARAAYVVRGDKVLAGTWGTLEKNLYDPIQEELERLSDLLADGESGMYAPYYPSDLETIRFTFRSSAEYGTVKGTEIGSDTFAVYQAPWAYLSQHSAALLKDVKIDRWVERSVADTYPWPGADSRSDSYVQMESESNIDPETGLPQKGKLKDSGGTLTPGSFDEYEVAKTT